MDEHTFRVLEFDKILQMAAAFAVTAPGKAIIQRIRPLHNIEEIRHQIDLLSECRRLITEGQCPDIESFEDLSLLFQRIRPDDAVLQPFELRSFLPLIYSSLNLTMLRHNQSCPLLGMMVSRLTAHPDLKTAIETSIDREGRLLDEASQELSYIRQGIRAYEKKIKGMLEGILKRKELEPHLQDFFIAERNKRWVIPVKRDAKGSVPGIVHDISNTGETVYVEPYAIQHLGNEMESYRAEEKLEEYRVLRRLSAHLREHLHEIEEDYQIVSRIDALQAIAGFSDQLDMSPPEINEEGYVNIIKGRHPLLWKTLRKEHREEELVPLDLEIGNDHSCMVITGSNAGGKTVALKTTGILSLMALSGMHTPSGEASTFPCFTRVFADIGDDQSIEQNRSTFSAHITRISEIIRQSSSDTLIIIDELGTGTDPEQGGALSCAVLRKLRQHGALAVVSTHLGMLKSFAHSESGMINSAMEMEEVAADGVSTYRPTYRLVTGEPGTSHAFEIAESLGLNEDVIREARTFVTGQGVTTESLISDLKRKTREIDKRMKETEKVQLEVAQQRSNLNAELSKLKSMKQDILSQALRKAEEILRKTKREAAEIMKTLKQSSLPKAGEVIKDLDTMRAELNKDRELRAPEKIQKLREVSKGQRVFIKPLGTHGILRSVNMKTRKSKVQISGKEIIIPFAELYEPIGDSSGQLTPQPSEKGKGEHSFASGEDIHIPHELNVIGKRVDPALSLIERFLNDASLAGLTQIKIIHGIGTGILASAIRNYLEDHPLVERSRKGNEDEGGEAVTIVKL